MRLEFKRFISLGRKTIQACSFNLSQNPEMQDEDVKSGILIQSFLLFGLICKGTPVWGQTTKKLFKIFFSNENLKSKCSQIYLTFY